MASGTESRKQIKTEEKSAGPYLQVLLLVVAFWGFAAAVRVSQLLLLLLLQENVTGHLKRLEEGRRERERQKHSAIEKLRQEGGWSKEYAER